LSNALEQFDRRQAARQQRSVGARVLTAGGLAVGALTVCNLSSTGALLRAADCSGLERGFGLLIDGENVVRRCIVAWRSGSQVGVRFVRPEATSAVIAADILGRDAILSGGTSPAW
jgi:hypothetical protein